MIDNYYLESEINYIDGKRKISNFKMYNHGEYIKTFSLEESKVINRKIKEGNIEKKIYGNMMTIDNQRFINFITRHITTRA